ncbi:hypothetical protein pdul_cds_367 [Pandoravirus dulcis]|uniref:Uncharacterized protein n=1 Tax=Pandoravirus dulcis TaxID=1349409 RepID=S4VWV1_9VIRU|nr:hypothetical protein pdul_cds_367 [Pandoravirus dulcis]AGO82394.1 hypothetical protein pdul_cds_367 [Pandoravirus dulcis]
MRKRAAPSSAAKKTPKSSPRQKGKAATKADADGEAPAAAATTTTTTRKRPTRLFPTDPAATRRVVAFDVGIVNMAHAVVTLTGADDFAIESLASDNIMRDDPPGGPPTDDEVIAASRPPRRRRPGEPKPLASPKPKGRGAKEPLKVLTERLTAYLWARADRLLGHRPHAVVIEQQSKKALRLSALGAVIHSFVLNYYMGRGEEVPPVFMQSGRQKLRVVFRPLPSSSASSSSGSSGGGIAAWCAPPSAGSAPRLVTRFRVPPPVTAAASTTTVVKATKARAKGTNGTGQETKAKPKSKAKQRRAEESAVWRANKKHAVVNFALILAHYPGCRRWKPLFERSKKKDDLADAALHAIFLLKAGGTRLARTKDLDDASLIVLPARSDDGTDCVDGAAAETQETVERKKPLRRRAAAVAPPMPPRVAGAPSRARPTQVHGEDDDGIIDLVHYAAEGDDTHGLSDAQSADDDDDVLADPSDIDDDDDDSTDDDDDDTTDDDGDGDDDVDDDVDDDGDFAEPVFKRARGRSSRAATTTRPTAAAFSDDSDRSDTEGEDDDSAWAADLGICPPPSVPASPARSRRG